MSESKPASSAMSRADIFSAAALILSVAGVLFSGGVVWAEVQQNSQTNEDQEAKLDELIPAVARIEENVEFLAEAERDRREAERNMQ